VSAQKRVDRGTIAIEGHEGDVGLGQLLERRESNVEGRSGTEAAHRHAAGLRARNVEQIVEQIRAAAGADFAFVREELGLSDSALSKQLSTLEEAGYLQTRKRRVGKYPRTSTRLTRAGRRAFAGHVAALQQLLRLPAHLQDVSAGAARSS